MKRRVLIVGMVAILVVVTAGCGRGELDGIWVCPGNSEWQVDTWEFSGNRFTYTEVTTIADSTINGTLNIVGHDERVTMGAFSISGDLIEFIYEDGDIRVFSFWRTENTITINHRQFNRVR